MSEGDVENFEILKSKLNNGDIVYNQSTSSEIYKEGVQNLTNKEDISSVLSGDLKSLPANCYLENKDDSHCNATYLEKQINLNMPRDACKINPEMRSEVSKAIKFHQEYLISQNSTNQITTNKVAINELDEIKMNICHENEGIFSPANDFSETCEIVFFNNEGLTNERDMNSQEELKKQSDIFINNSDNSEKDIFLEKNVNSLPEGVEPQKNSYMIIMSNERQENEMFYNKIYENISDKETYKNETNLKDAVMSSSIRNSELKDEIIVVDEKHLITSDESVNIESSNLENKINDTSKIESLNTFTNKKSSKARKSLISKSSNSQVNNKVPIAVENIFNDLVSIESDNNSLIMQEQKSSAPNSFNSIISDIEIEKLHIQRHSAHLESSLVSPDSKIESSCHSKLPITLSFNNENKKRTAKKSFARNCVESSDDSSSDSDKLKNKVLSYSTKKFVDKSPKNAAKSFQYLNNNRINGDYQNTPLINNFSKSSDSVNEQRPTALKTFKKPFTVAKKSIAKETAYKTVIESYFKIRTAKKTYNKLHRSIQSTSVIELSADESSDEEVKNSPVCWSPAKDLKLSKTICLCSSKELLCLCNGQRLRLICEAEDSIDDEIVPCTKAVSQHHLLTPSSNLKHKIFCDIHLWRLKNHHCCPKCGYFCTQGTFLCCKYDQAMKETNENHLFHPRCLLVPDSCFPPGCPHCCMFSDFKNVHLSYVFGNENSQIANGNSDEQSEVNITDKFQNYHIFMTTQDDKSVNPIKVDCSSVPQLQDLKVMLMEITKEATLRLRPAGKCLFNPIKAGDIKKVLQFIANGVNPNHKFNTHKNNTPLHIAAYYGFTSIVHALLMYGASIDAINDDLETPLILAVEKNQLEVVQYLIHAGAQVDVKNENGLTAFHVACKNNYKEIAELLYKTGKFDVNIQDDGGWTPLVWACEKNCVDVVQWLVNLGADPNVRDNEENTALHWAACSGSCKILEIILNNGCYINFVNQRGDSALHIAARKDNFTCVQLLLKRNALLDCINKEGEAPIMCCDDDSVSWEILNNHLLNSAKLENISQQQHVVSRDISRGKENYPIQAVNEVDKEEFIMDFRYVTRNCFAPNLTVTRTVDSMELCYCKDNCSSSDCTCTRLSRCWYNLDGLLISDFDLYDPPSIYECNKTCHCPKSCINRVVQKGLRIPLQLFRTLNRGWGVRTLKFLTKGTFVCEYVGEVISENEISRRPDDTYFFDLDSSSGDYCVDGRFFGNIARFINHSCEPNLVSIRVFVEHQDLNFPRIAFFTMRDIEAFEELCFDYGIEFWVAKSRHFLCTCNSSLCKYSKDSIDSTLVEYIQEKDKQTEVSMDT
ncbi:hypothetical protein CDAR_505911 [Caerostris darwini]|uniref:Histone-lysine N-methyltransferase EHMT2 n=1 Tax=Caerostris darwini TaxID=1538125 RepID=A0AAV4QAB8_9ARAC|nr:hypothetical protein CDAR_505911 [Caerostris darwini]